MDFKWHEKYGDVVRFKAAFGVRPFLSLTLNFSPSRALPFLTLPHFLSGLRFYQFLCFFLFSFTRSTLS